MKSTGYYSGYSWIEISIHTLNVVAYCELIIFLLLWIYIMKSIPLSVDKIFLQKTALQLQLARTPIRMGIHGLCAGTRVLSGRLEVHVGKLGIRLHRDHVRTVWDGGKIKEYPIIVQLRAIFVVSILDSKIFLSSMILKL